MGRNYWSVPKLQQCFNCAARKWIRNSIIHFTGCMILIHAGIKLARARYKMSPEISTISVILSRITRCCVRPIWYVTSSDIDRNAVKSLKLNWNWCTRSFQLRMSDLQVNCSDLTSRESTRIVVPLMATRVTDPIYHQGPLLLTWFNFNPCMDK